MTIRAEVDGIGVLEFPDGTAPEVIQRTVRNVVGQQQKPDFAPGAAQIAIQGATLGTGEEIQAGIGAGYAKLFGGNATKNVSLGELYRQARDELRADNDEFREAYPKSSLALEIGGGIATGGGALKLASKGKDAGKIKTAYDALKAAPLAKQGAILGGTGGAIAGAGYSDAETAGDVAIDAGIGAAAGVAFGVAAPKLIEGVSSAFRRAVGSPQIQVFDDAGQFTQEAIKKLDDLVASGVTTQDDAQAMIRESLVKEGVLTPEQAQRFNLFARRGVTPVRADITQRTSDFVDKQSALKRTGPVAQRVAEQDDQITRAVADSIDAIKPATTSPAETSSFARSVVDDVALTLDNAVGEAYTAARAAARGQPFVKLNSFARAISDNRGSENATGGVISYAEQLLKNKGLVKAGEKIDINKRGRRASGDTLKKLTVNEAEEIRQGLNSLYDSVTPAGRRMIHELKNAIDDDVAGTVGEDLFQEARAAKTLFHSTIEKARRNKFDKSSGSFLEDVLYNKIPEEKIYSKLMSARDDDFMKFHDFLNESGERGQQAWKNIKAQALRDALDKALGTMGKGEGGRPVWNARSFKNAFNAIRNTKKYETLFNADEQALIDDIAEIGRLRIPPSLVQQGKGPTEIAVDQLRVKVLKAVPWVGDGAQELLDSITTRKTDRKILDPTLETVKTLTNAGGKR